MAGSPTCEVYPYFHADRASGAVRCPPLSVRAHRSSALMFAHADESLATRVPSAQLATTSVPAGENVAAPNCRSALRALAQEPAWVTLQTWDCSADGTPATRRRSSVERLRARTRRGSLISAKQTAGPALCYRHMAQRRHGDAFLLVRAIRLSLWSAGEADHGAQDAISPCVAREASAAKPNGA